MSCWWVILVVGTSNNGEDDAGHDLCDVAYEKLMELMMGIYVMGTSDDGEGDIDLWDKDQRLGWRCQGWYPLWWGPEMMVIIYTSSMFYIITGMCVTIQCSEHRAPHLSNGEGLHSSDYLLGRLLCCSLWGSGPLCRSTGRWLHM